MSFKTTGIFLLPDPELKVDRAEKNSSEKIFYSKYIYIYIRS